MIYQKDNNTIKKYIYQNKKTSKQAVCFSILDFIYNSNISIKLLIINIITKLDKNIITQIIKK